MADAVTTQTIHDSVVRAVVNLTNTSDGTGETNVLKVNAAALTGAVKLMTVAAGANTFKIGETVFTGNSTSNSTATVADVNEARTVWTLINVSDANGHFINGATVTGATTTKTRAQSGALASGTYRLSATRIVYNVSNDASVKLLWGGTSNGTAIILTGSGIHDLSAQGLALKPSETDTPNGNLLVTTVGFAANSTYSVLVELKKTSGYAQPNTERNPDLGYANDR